MSIAYGAFSLLILANAALSVKEKKVESQILFPDTFNASHSTSMGFEKKDKEIPLDLIRRLNEAVDVEEFFQNFVEPITIYKGGLLQGLSARIGSENVERNALKAAKMAKCIPELRTIPLKPDKTTATFYYPSCTRVERCGGCCSHHLLSCQPVESEIIPMSIVAADYIGGNKLQFRGKKIIEVEQHTKCKCECKIRPQDCSRYQKYNPDKCQCECTNSDEERKCDDERSKKIWNSDNCSCICKEEQECGSGFYFDPFNCSCKSYLGRKKPNFHYNVN